MTRNSFIAAIKMIGFKLKSAYVMTYELHDVQIYTDDRCSLVTIRIDGFEIKRYEYKEKNTYIQAMDKIIEISST